MQFPVLKTITVALFCLAATVSCKDNASNIDDSENVEGLWQLNSTEGDISHVNITATTVTSYDYQGDEFDEGEDCYIIMSEEILEIEGDIYKFRDPDNQNSTIDVRITVNGNQLTVEQPFGNGTVSLKFTRSNDNTNSFTPECEEEVQQKSHILGL